MTASLIRVSLAILAIVAYCHAFHGVSIHEVEDKLSPEQLRAAVDHKFDVAPDYTLAKVDMGSTRSRRDAGDVSLSMRLFNKTIIVDVHPSKIVSDSYVLQELGPDGKLHDVPHHASDCYYVGYVEGEPETRVAISLCEDDKMDGMVYSGSHIIVLKPVKNTPYHMAYKATEVILTNKTVDHMEDKESIVPYVAKKIEEGVRERRQTTRETLEMMVYIDRATVNYHGSANVDTYVMNMLNIFASLYADASLGGPPVHISLVRMIKETTTTSPISSSTTVNTLLDSFCVYQSSSTFPSSDSDARHHDFAVFLTRRNICSSNGDCGTVGYAPVGTMCSSSRSCAIVEDQGLPAAFTMAHEAGHVFQMRHDGTGNTCNPSGNIMAAILGGGKGLFKWSTCSAQYLRQFRQSKKTGCLSDSQSSQTSISATALPGTTFNADAQCKAIYGSASSLCTPQDLSTICTRFFCRNGGSCYTNNVPPADGTVCGNKKVCYRGNCVDASGLGTAVHGGWSSWGAWSSCSKTCGGGVRLRNRKCNNPIPQFGGDYCAGQESQATYCNPTECSGGDTFRQEQCEEQNDKPFNGVRYEWDYYPQAPVGPCEIACINGQFYAQFGNAKDGTSCSPSDGYNKGVCVAGSCYNVGCNNQINGQKFDKCGVCNGDGSTCTEISKTFQQSYSRTSYYTTVVLPKNARNVRIVEDPPNGNSYFALTVGGTRRLNANFRIGPGSDFKAAGSDWTYRRSSTSETLATNGPLLEPCTVEVLVDRSASVRFTYSYTEPNGVTTAPTTQAPTTRATTQAPTTRATTQAPTTRATTQAPTTRATTQAPTTRATTQAPTTRATTQAPTTRATTQAPTTRATTQAPTTRATTKPTTTANPKCTSSCRDRYTACPAYKGYCPQFRVLLTLCCRTCNDC